MVQVLPWASNRYVRKAAFAYITFDSLKRNLNPKNWVWDDNKFFNNQLSHPYQGSLYFNAFRTNGFNFWESAPAVVAGSYVWETFFENHAPAPNDLINTSLGGIAFGEMSNRLSKLILRRKQVKTKNILREPFALLINPMNGLNRVLDHEWGKPADPGCIDDSPASIVADAGTRLIIKKIKKFGNQSQMEAFGRFHLQYGDPFNHFKKPFSNFTFLTELGNSDSAKANTIQIEGCIYGIKMKETKKKVQVFNVSMNYDYFQNSAFVYGPQSFKANLLSSFHLSKNIQLQTKAGIGIIVLAAVPDTYMYYGEGRKYDYASGINLQLGAGINIANKVFYNINGSAAAVKTINGYKSSHQFFNTQSELRIVIYKNISVTASSSNYFFNGYYKNYSNVYDHFVFRHFGIGYKIPL